MTEGGNFPKSNFWEYFLHEKRDREVKLLECLTVSQIGETGPELPKCAGDWEGGECGVSERQ